MNVDSILLEMNRHDVRYLLVGGMNFMLRHAPVLTYDVDLWIEDTEANRARCEKALSSLNAEWGTSEREWRPVAEQPAGWLGRQTIFSLTSPHGSIDIFRAVTGLDNWAAAYGEGAAERTGAGVPYRGLSDRHMLQSQEALDPGEQKADRMAALRKKLDEKPK